MSKYPSKTFYENIKKFLGYKYPSKTFCIYPWTHIAVTASGNLRLCCEADNILARSMPLQVMSSKPYKIYEDSIADAWHSQYYQQVREKMLNGEQPAPCSNCYLNEKNNIYSTRARSNTQYMFDIEQSVTPPMHIKYLDLRLGNLCNLKCRMCFPGASSKWAEDWPMKLDEGYDWPEHPYVWEQLEPFLDTVEKIYLTGGEPTLTPGCNTLYEICIEKDVAKNIVLSVTTNLTNIPEKLVGYWKHFKKVEIGGSIDAYGKLNRYIRHPSNWNMIDKNLRKWIDISKEHPTIFLERTNTTVQMYNILNLSELLDYFEEIQSLTSISIKSNFFLVTWPPEFNIHLLPKELKELATNRLHKYNQKEVQDIISYMHRKDSSDEFITFVKSTNNLDKKRSENLFDLVPEYKQYFL